MKSVADAMRARTTDAVLALSARERIALALSLGDDDLDLYMRTSGADRATALRQLHGQRAHDRTVCSRSASATP